MEFLQSKAIPEDSLQRFFNFRIQHADIESSVVRYSRYLDTYRRYPRDDTGIAKVTIYRGIS